MNKIQKRRLSFICLFIAGLFIIAGLVLYALRQNINVFLTPKQITAQSIPQGYHFRLGGLVKQGTLQHAKTGLGVDFTVTDLKQDLRVHYEGVLPDLFREGKGVVAQGSLNAQGIFIASEILAKHDENYVPRNVVAQS